MPTKLAGNLKEFVNRFDELVEDFYTEHGPDWSSDNFHRGPCLYFHRATIQHVRRQTRPFAEWLPGDQRYHELLYATLTAWGMNSSGAKLKDFQEFQRAVSYLASMDALERCRHIELEHLTHEYQPLVEELFEALSDDRQAKIMRSSSITVGSSKLLHHLLPDLFPPIDREFTKSALELFDDENKLPNEWDTFKTFWHILAFFRKVVCAKTSKRIRERWLNDGQKHPMNTSIPKVIDNAFIAYRNSLYPED